MVGFNGFLARWQELQLRLTTEAGYIGVSPDNIVLGNFQEGTQIEPPGLIVYMVPGDLLLGDTPQDNIATFKIFPVIPPSPSIPEALAQAVDMGWRVYRVLKKWDGVVIRWPKNKVQMDTATTMLTAARVEGLIEYDIV